MPIFSRDASALEDRKPVVVEGDTYYKSDWMDSGRDPENSPTVFLVEQAPHVSLRTHFHRQNQFQLFVRGGGRLGPHDVSALTVHYAGAYTGYGRFDSLAVANSGHICAAAVEGCSIAEISPTAGLLGHHAVPDMLTTNICFGGPALRTAYVTLSHTGRLGAMEWHEPGLRLAHQNNETTPAAP